MQLASKDDDTLVNAADPKWIPQNEIDVLSFRNETTGPRPSVTFGLLVRRWLQLLTCCEHRHSPQPHVHHQRRRHGIN